jgi:transposase InsO family protein
MVYLAAIIDWHSKAVLSHRISNIMDSTLVMDVLDEAALSFCRLLGLGCPKQAFAKIATPRLFFSRCVWISLVYWLPWSVLNISGVL